MALEIAEYPVQRVVFGGSTTYHDGVLEVDPHELRALVLQDTRFQDAAVDLARPGEDVRITFVSDAVDARLKVSGPGTTFPGTLGPPDPVGEGRTHVLAGLAVMGAGEIPSVFRGPRSALLDMHHPEPDTPYHHTHNLVLAFEIQAGLSDRDYHHAIQGAELRVARRLAEATLGQPPARLTRLAPETREPRLPSVVLVQVLRGHRDAPPCALYGFPLAPGQAPMFVRPTEFHDGAVTSSPLVSAGTYPSTWYWCNHPLVQALCRDHGQELNFLGAFVLVRPDVQAEKEFMAHRIARLARAMGASGAVISNPGTGNGLIDVMSQCQAFEREGIKTVVVTPENAPESVDSSRLAFTVPEADAMVSTGTEELDLELGPARRVIGPPEIPLNMDAAPNIRRVPASDPLRVHTLRPLFGAHEPPGHGRSTIREY